ncbi:MAG: HMA2 domain-containing protein [Anaerolineae bacterium]
MDSLLVRVVHFVPGRIRFRIPAVKGDPVLAEEIRRWLESVPAVQRAEANAVTGSLLVSYDAEALVAGETETVAQALLGHYVGRLVIDPEVCSSASTSPTRSYNLNHELAEFFTGVNANVNNTLRGTADLRALVPVSLFALGLGSLLFTRPLTAPSWHDLMWYAFNSFLSLNRLPSAASPQAAMQPSTPEGAPIAPAQSA